MSDAEDMASSFGRATEDDKLESFERSTLKIVLRRMGMKKQRVDRLDAQLAEGFTFDWLQNQGWNVDRLVTTRCFHFDLQALIKSPEKSELMTHIKELWSDQTREPYDGVIFRAHGIGRMVCTVDGMPHTLTLAPSLNVPFKLTGHVEGQWPLNATFATLDDYCTAHFTGEEIEE